MLRRKNQVDADFYEKQKQSEAEILLAEAQSVSVQKVINAFNGDIKNYLVWKMLQERVFETICSENAKAVQGLQPKISIWNTGTGNDTIGDTLNGFLQQIPPIFQTIKDQTGMDILPGFLISLF